MVQESPAKKARTEANEADCEIIEGVKYDRALLEQARKAEKDADSGQISAKAAKKLWMSAKGGKGVTDVHRDTFKYVMDNLKCDKPAKEALEKMVNQLTMKESVEKAGKKWEEAMEAAKLAEAAAKTAKDEATKAADEAAKAADEAAKAADEAAKAANEALQVKKLADDAASKTKEQATREAALQTAAVEADKKAKKAKKASQAAKKFYEHERAQEEEDNKLREKYGKLFDQMDTLKNGILSPDELKAWVSNNEVEAVDLGIGAIDKFLKEADTDDSGEVDRDEFIDYYVFVNLDKEKCCNALFDAIDVSGDGIISMQEVRDYQWLRNSQLFVHLGIYSWQTLETELDTNRDGNIDRSEFVAYLMKKL
eukprot:TRINITY_DN14920_c0_g1_i1.p1 TRINITY_DN14920_c0_g1~~TRINITY_DN14920_c0_g1_i1.p1  ORF type:complete len:368 (-),score=144.62 TRINITY_DN14920_c0_g1_i1:41-1144(-)